MKRKAQAPRPSQPRLALIVCMLSVCPGRVGRDEVGPRQVRTRVSVDQNVVCELRRGGGLSWSFRYGVCVNGREPSVGASDRRPKPRCNRAYEVDLCTCVYVTSRFTIMNVCMSAGQRPEPV